MFLLLVGCAAGNEMIGREGFMQCGGPDTVGPIEPCYYLLTITGVGPGNEVIGKAASTVVEENRTRGIFHNTLADYKFEDYVFHKHRFQVQESDMPDLRGKVGTDVMFVSVTGEAFLTICKLDPCKARLSSESKQ